MTQSLPKTSARGYEGGASEQRVGFFTDTSLCIGCKACEVACKEWNHVEADGYAFSGESMDNTGGLSATTWRHVAFIEQSLETGEVDLAGWAEELADSPAGSANGAPTLAPGAGGTVHGPGGMRWLMASDVCKHCTHAACLEVCPTGSLFRTEFGTVVVQEDVCNGCGYCIPACPFGVIDRNEDDGRAWKCTLCYDRLRNDQEPACAKACPTNSIQFGELSELRERAKGRVEELHRRGATSARLYLEGEDDNEVGGGGAFFLLLDEPEVYGLPPMASDAARVQGRAWRAAAGAMVGIAATVAAAFVVGS